MSILSTNKKLIRIGDDYSAGSGIDITDRVISVTSFGPEYSAGPNIDIQDYVISGRDWSEEINAISANANSAFNEWVSNDYTTDQTNITNKFTFVSGEIDNKLDKSESAKYYPMEGNPSGFLTQHQDLTYLSGKVDEKLDTTAFSTVSGDFLTSIPDEYATKDFVSSSISSKLDISSFSSVSGDFVTNNYIQNNYYSKTDTSSKEELADAFNNVNVPSSVLDLSGFEYNSQNLISGYGGSAFAGQGGGAEYTGIAPIVVNNETDTIGLDTFILSGGENVDLVEDYENNIVRIDIDLSGMSFDDYYKKTETSSKDEITNALGGLSNDYYPLTGNPSGFLTEHQSLTNYYTKNETSSRDELNTAIQYVSANAGKTYTGVSPIVVNNTTNEISADAWVLSGGDGISLVDDNINNITRIDVTAQGGDPEVQGLVRSNSSTWDSVTNKLDTTAFSTVSGTFLTTAFGISESAHWEEATNAYEQNSGAYLTSHQDLSDYAKSSALNDYQTIAGMTAYQPAGSYATTNELEQVSADITATIPSTAGLASESYVQTNSAVLTAMIDGKQDTLTFGYDEQDRISAINSSALAGGGSVPEDVMVEPNLEYNAVNEISGYNGSAIAQYGAEKQWLVHDDTLVHAANSAQYALGCNISALQRLMGIDETLLYSATGPNVTTFTLNESPMNFNEIKVYTRGSNWGVSDANRGGNNYFFPIEQFSLNRIGMLGQFMGGTSTSNQFFAGAYYSGTSSTTWTKYLGYVKNINTTANADWPNSAHMFIYKIIGVGRNN